MKRLIYRSTSAAPVTWDTVSAVVESASANNEAQGITGLLLLAGDTFLQVLEGEAARVDHTFARIRRDGRHRDVTLLMDAAVPERLFAEWGLAAVRLDRVGPREAEALRRKYGARAGSVVVPDDGERALALLLDARALDASTRDPGTIRVVTGGAGRDRLLRRAQRVETLGHLAGGIAHDLNNVLGPLMMSLELLELRLGDDPAARRLVEQLERATQRGAGLVHQLLAYIRGAQGKQAAIAVAPLVDEVGSLLRSTLPPTIRLALEVEDGLGAVRGDPTQLHQVVMNLAVNARDAMPNGGTLRIAAGAHAAEGGPAVRISVSDTGPGIPPEMLREVFEPFFTTKAEGTGLGLTTVMDIVREHGGTVTVESAGGAGARFDVLLPASDEAALPEAPAAGAEADEAPRGRGELVLVVDDEAAARAAASAVLRAHGYRTATAEHGAAALEAYREHGGAVRVVLTDMMMPVMGGPELARSLAALAPDLPVIGMSGLPDHGGTNEGRADLARFLGKPFRARSLLEAVAAALAAAPAPAPAAP